MKFLRILIFALAGFLGIILAILLLLLGKVILLYLLIVMFGGP